MDIVGIDQISTVELRRHRQDFLEIFTNQSGDQISTVGLRPVYPRVQREVFAGFTSELTRSVRLDCDLSTFARRPGRSSSTVGSD